MLKNLRVRTKLIAVLAVPLAGLIVMATIGVLDRRSDAAEARDGRRLAELTAARVALTHQLQLERTWTAAAVSGDRTYGVDELTAQRQTTDAAVEAFRSQAGSARSVSGALGEQLDRVIADLQQLQDVRVSIDEAQVNPQVSIAYYSRVLLGMSDLAGLTSNAARGTDLQGDLASLDALAGAKEAEANLHATVAQMLVDREGRAPQFDAITNAQRQYDEQIQRFIDLASDSARRDLQTREAASDSQASNLLLRQVINLGANVPLTVDAGEWIGAATARLDTLRGVEDFVTTSVDSQATTIEQDATAAARNFLVGAIGVVLVSLLLASLVARSIARPLGRLTEGAYRLSEERLPALVEQLRNPESDEVGEALQPIDIDSKDEIGQLASAFNAIQDVTKTVASEQASLLRKGIGDIFVNLARRNQTLLDRQIEFIDQLEAREEDPDQLENLFKLDHLATRMRRNAESLLVLAGAEPPHRRGRPVDMADVVRVAIGEVEHFARITLLALDEGTVSASVAVDLAHLLSELMENATQFSPPETQVEIVGHKTRDGSYVISVSDQGIGMTPEQLAEANRLIANPPVVGLALSRSLGFIVIGRLAARFGISVRLVSSASGGVSALVTLPASLVDADPVREADAPTTEVSHEPLPAIDLGSSAPTETPVVDVTDADVLDSSVLDAPPFTETPAFTESPAVPEAPASDTVPATDDAPSVLDDAVPTPGDADVAPVQTPADLGLTPIVDEPVTPPAPPAPAEPVAEPVAEQPPAEPTVAEEHAASTPATSLPPPPPPPADAQRPSLSPPPGAPAGPTDLPTREPVLPSSWESAPNGVPSYPAAPPTGTPPPLPSRRPQPVAPDSPVTAGGLTRRVPKAPAPSATLPASAPVAATQRTPEEVRQMLSRYRSGLRRGRLDENDTTTEPRQEG